ncbi:MAG: hypothetical protein WDZ52_15335 [Pseudohongiellaceae bacterium]
MHKIRIVITFIVLAASNFLYAAGPYDGIWQTSDSTYSTVNQNGSTVIVVGLDLVDGDFAISTGELVGSELVLSTAVGNGAQIVSRVNFISATSATVTLLSCVPDPGYICTLPNGIALTITKVF